MTADRIVDRWYWVRRDLDAVWFPARWDGQHWTNDDTWSDDCDGGAPSIVEWQLIPLPEE